MVLYATMYSGNLDDDSFKQGRLRHERKANLYKNVKGKFYSCVIYLFIYDS